MTSVFTCHKGHDFHKKRYTRTFFLGGSSLPGLSKEGWRDRNSVIKLGKAAASNLMSVVCGKQREIIEILGNDANGLKLSIFCAEGNMQLHLLHLLQVTMFSPVLGSTMETCGHSVIG